MSKNQIHSLLTSQKPIIIAGIGNDDPLYTNTYHNIGFLCIDYILEKHVDHVRKKSIPLTHHVSAWKCSHNRILIKNNSYMNTSGEPLARALSFFSIPPDNLIVIHDDYDIALGEYKISFEKNDAGHNGVSSIIQTLQTNAFYRIRIGIQPQDISRKKALDLVLSPISKQHHTLFLPVFQEVEELICGDILA